MPRLSESGGSAGRRTILFNDSKGPTLVQFRGRLIEALVAGGHRVHVTAPDLDGAIAKQLKTLGAEPHSVPLARTGLNPIADLHYFRTIRRLLRQTAADLSLNFTIKPNIWGSLAAKSRGIPSVSVVTGLGYAFIDRAGAKRWLAGKMANLLYRAATAANEAVIFQNPDDRNYFLSHGMLANSNKARLVNGSGVDLTHYRPRALPPDAVFLMVSRLLGNKGVREFASAALELLQRRKDVRFVLAGFIDDGHDGIDSAELEGWIASGIEFLGNLDDVRPAIGQASVFVLPSYAEGTPRSVLEAMAMGRAIITTDVAGCRETVIEGVNGLLVPAKDPAALAEAMTTLADQPDLRRTMGQASTELCRTKYNVNEVNALLMEFAGL